MWMYKILKSKDRAVEWVKMQPICILPVRDSPQVLRDSQIESEGVEKDVSRKCKQKESWGNYTYI